MIVFSDLDGCLLDHGDGYGCDEARPALAALRAAGVPLVLCSGKTRAEMEPIARRLSLETPLVVENGGAVVHDGRLLALGTPRPTLLRALPRLAAEARVELRGFSQMTTDEVAALTGLDHAGAGRALLREYDEPFAVRGAFGRDPALDARLDRAARGLGLRVTHGGWLHHLHGPADKGDGVRLVLERLGVTREDSVGVGDSASDVPLLRAVARPIAVPGPGGLDPAIVAALPGAERAPRPGPRGWGEALLAVLRGTALSRVAS